MATQASREAELALLLVGTSARRARTAPRIAELAAAVNHQALASALARQRVLTLAGARLLQVVPSRLPPPFRTRMEAVLARARGRARAFIAATGFLADTLERAGIPALPLKGATLAAELYGDPALREYDDIDILVPRLALGAASAATAALGWTLDDGEANLPRLHRRLQHPDGALPVVELHWRVHWYESAFAADLLRRSRIDGGVRRLAPIDQLATLLLFYARDGFTGLRYVADIAAWWDAHGNAEVPEALARLMAGHPALAEPWRAALAAAVPVGGLPAAALSPECRPRRRRTALATRLANWDLRGDVDQVHANVTLVDGLLTPPGDLGAFARRRVLSGGRHAAKLGARYALAWWHVRRRRSWSPPPSCLDRGATMPGLGR
jgi:hypothetical protein